MNLAKDAKRVYSHDVGLMAMVRMCRQMLDSGTARTLNGWLLRTGMNLRGWFQAVSTEALMRHSADLGAGMNTRWDCFVRQFDTLGVLIVSVILPQFSEPPTTKPFSTISLPQARSTERGALCEQATRVCPRPPPNLGYEMSLWD